MTMSVAVLDGNNLSLTPSLSHPSLYLSLSSSRSFSLSAVDGRGQLGLDVSRVDGTKLMQRTALRCHMSEHTIEQFGFMLIVDILRGPNIFNHLWPLPLSLQRDRAVGFGGHFCLHFTAINFRRVPVNSF